MSEKLSRAHLRLALFVGIGLFAGSAVQANEAAKNRVPYDSAMRCYVAYGYESDERQDVGDASGAALYEKKAKTAFGTAEILGKAMGFSRDQIKQDFATMQDRELPKLVKDRTYFGSVSTTCAQIGL